MYAMILVAEILIMTSHQVSQLNTATHHYLPAACYIAGVLTAVIHSNLILKKYDECVNTK